MDAKRSWIAPTALAAVSLSLAFPKAARADEGGVSFWAPGQFSSLAAVPGDPGFSVPLVYYHASANASDSKNFLVGGNLTAGIDATGDLLFAFPTYTFSSPVVGGQAALGLGWAFGTMHGKASVVLVGPLGNPLTEQRSDSVTGGSDLYGLGTLKWHAANNNYMAYAMLGAPVGAYELDRLANLGTNHWSVDGGAGYTYFNEKTGREFSMVVGVTYNLENNATNYQNGVDSHIDWAASQFLSEQVHVGLVGYFFYQLTGDTGSGAVLGDFKSRVSAVGPQVGYFFPVGKQKGYVNLKGYWEFDAANRAAGWNAWVSLAWPLEASQ